MALRRLKMAPRIFPAIQTARKGFLKLESHFFNYGKLPRPPSKTVTPTPDVERQEDGNCMLSHRDYEVEACNL